VDTITQITDTHQIASAYAAVIGHPHLAVSTARPAMADLEQVVSDWAGDPGPATKRAGDPSDGRTLEVVGNVEASEHITLDQPDGGAVRMELTAEGTLRYPPGHPDAVHAGCLCDPEKNQHGLGAQSPDDEGAYFITKRFCPLHERVGPPPPQ
jgi:hypothetical protein